MLIAFLLTSLLLPGATSAPADSDSDRDGLTDFHEVHKHRTDPEDPDSDGDGVPDGDWHERREFTYVVRSVVHVMRPVTPEFLTDDYQDARVLDEADGVVELEVIHYPLSTAGDEVPADPNWRETVAAPEFRTWLEPGPTSDWDTELRDELTADLLADGIDVRELDDRSLVEEASAWLLRRAEFVDGFTTFCTAFDERGAPFVPEDLRGRVNDGTPPTRQQWSGEISAKGMYRARTRGSCSSSAIYLSGCLRALGVPTRTILCIPIVDAGDGRERELVEQSLSQPFVRRTVLGAIEPLRRSWASHTFNEVFVGGRWRRLDYDELGVGILRAERFGLMTHVATFRDWADARMPETIGRRQALDERTARLDGANPYSTIALRDELGPHADLTLPEVEPLVLRVAELHWTDDPDLDEDVRHSIERAARFGLLARFEGVGSSRALSEALALGDLRVFLEAEGRPRLSIGFDPGCWWYSPDRVLVYLPFGATDRQDLAPGVAYRVQARNESAEVRWEFPDGPVVRR